MSRTTPLPRRGGRRARLAMLAGLAAVGLSCGGDGGPTAPEATPEHPNPAPSVASISPAQAGIGTSSFTLTVTGSDFVSASSIRWNGADRPTTFVSGEKLSATVPAADLTVAGPVAVTVATPAPGGGTSAELAFTVRDRTPSVATIAPTNALVGDAGLTIEVTGSDFTRASEVRWNGFARPTTFVSATRLTAAIPATDLAVAAVRSVSVATPYADPSGSASFTVLNPPPAATAIAPTAVNALSAAFTLVVTGRAFVPASVVRANGVERPTTYVSPTELRTTILPGDVPTPGTPASITVFTRAPGGGLSEALPLAVLNPTPILATLEPPSAPAGASGATIAVRGERFVAGAVVRWNGEDRPTTFVDATRLSVAIPASDLASRATAQITVANPAPGGGVSAARTFVVTTPDVSLTSQLVVDLATRDIVADPVRQRLYVSVPSSDPTRGNTVTAIDPVSGAILFSVPVGNGPSKLAIADDGSFLYVGLDGEFAVRRVDLASATADIRFAVGESYWGPMTVGDMEVLPGTPRTVAIARFRPQVIPGHGGVAIYVDGVMRSTTTQEHTGSDEIAVSESPTMLYGYNSGSTEFGVRQLAVSASGITEVRVRSGVLEGYPWPTGIEAGAGRIFSTNGGVLDGATLSRIGTLPDTGLVRPDPAGGQVLYLTGTKLSAYHITELIPLGSVTTPTAGEGRLVRWGSDGVAYRSGARIVILRSNLIGP